MKHKFLSLAVVGAISLAWTVWAHHSHSNYDTNTFTELEGIVKEFRWINPHTWMYLEVMENGKPVWWTLEGGSPAALLRGGWKRDDIKAGDRVKVRCYRLKDGSNGCLFGFVARAGVGEKELD